MNYMSMVERLDTVLDKLDGLLEVQELYEAILNNIPFGMLVVDKDFIIERVNTPICEYTGYSREQLHGKPITALMPQEDRAIHKKHEKSFKKSPRVRVGNHGFTPRVQKANGDISNVEVSIAPFVFKGQGKVIVIIRDVQDIKESIE